MTPLQMESPPPRPSGLNNEMWNRRRRTTGPRIPSSSFSGSKRRVRSWRKGSISDGPNVLGFVVEDMRGAERDERDRSGSTSSDAPRGFLAKVLKFRPLKKDGENRTPKAEGTFQVPARSTLRN